MKKQQDENTTEEFERLLAKMDKKNAKINVKKAEKIIDEAWHAVTGRN